MTDALYQTSFKTILFPLNGYYVIVARAIGLLAALLPMSMVAAVLSISAALILGLMVVLVYVAAGAHFPSRLARVMVAVPLLIAPVAENNRSEIYNRPACLHLFALYVLFWVILWVPTKRIPQLVAVIAAGLAAGSTILTVAFIPLALLRVLVRRDRTGIGILAMLLIGAVANGMLALDGDTAGRGVMYPEPLTALWDYAIWALPISILGYRATMDLGVFHFPTSPGTDIRSVLSANLWVIVLAWAIVAVIVAVAVWRRFTRPAWLLAACAISAGMTPGAATPRAGATRSARPEPNATSGRI